MTHSRTPSLRTRHRSARALALGVSVLFGLTLASFAPAPHALAATAVPLRNASLKAAVNGVPSCWQRNGWGTNTATYTHLSSGHAGAWAERVSIGSYASGAARLVVRLGHSNCGPTITARHRYRLTGWYKTTGTARWVTWYLSRSSGKWQYWTSSPTLVRSTSWTQARYTTPAVPADAVRLSFGLSLQSTGTLTGDDYSVADVPPAAAPQTGTVWYVSRNGDNSTGKSWATAWNELSAIDWSAVQPGDTIEVDGGATSCGSNYDFASDGANRPGLNCGMLYRTPLIVGASGAPSAPITIRLSDEPGHNGTAVVFGGRTSVLPYCDQQSYAPSGTARSAGITIPGQSHVVINGRHRSGIMIYGAQSGVDLASDATSFVALRNLEIFDNGTFGTWSHGYRTDGEGISLAGHDITIGRDLIHDNGQDEIQDRYTGPINNDSHAAMHNISVVNSWLYDRRENPQFAGYGFNAGSQGIAAQDCTHVDGIQIWGGGLHQHALTVNHDVFGPLLAQGVYPGDENNTSFDHVTVSNTLFLNVLDHSMIGDPISGDASEPFGWKIENVTSYMTDQPNTGLASHGSVDLAGGGHTVTNSIFDNGYFAAPGGFSSASGNIWWGGDPVPGATHEAPDFTGPLPTGDSPSYDQLVAADLTANCNLCSGVGSPIHRPQDLLNRIDRMNGESVTPQAAHR